MTKQEHLESEWKTCFSSGKQSMKKCYFFSTEMVEKQRVAGFPSLEVTRTYILVTSMVTIGAAEFLDHHPCRGQRCIFSDVLFRLGAEWTRRARWRAARGHREVSYFGREAITPSYYKLHKCYKCYIFVLDSPWTHIINGCFLGLGCKIAAASHL